MPGLVSTITVVFPMMRTDIHLKNFDAFCCEGFYHFSVDTLYFLKGCHSPGNSRLVANHDEAEPPFWIAGGDYLGFFQSSGILPNS